MEIVKPISIKKTDSTTDEQQPTCKSCPFFFTDPNDKNIPHHAGQCRMQPPSIMILPAPGGINVAPMWPLMNEKQWCGKHPSRAADVTAVNMLNALDDIFAEYPGLRKVMLGEPDPFPPVPPGKIAS